MKAFRTRAALFIALVPMLSGCSLLNKLDVCERERPQEHAANVRTEGDQLANGQTPLAILPSGGAFLVFASEESGSSSNQEIRGTFLDASGERLPTCSESSEVTYAEAEEVKGFSWASTPSVAPPADGSSYGLITFLRVRASDEDLLDATTTVHAIPFDRFGCPVLDIAEVRIDDEESTLADFPTVVGLGRDRFAILWVSHGREDLTVRLLGRVIDTSGVIADFPPTAPYGESSGGAVVDLLPQGALYQGLAARALSENAFALAWTESTFGGGVTTYLGLFDDRFVMTDGPFVLNTGSHDNGTASSTQLALDFDGERFLVAWTAADDRGLSRAYGRFVDTEGSLMKGPDDAGVFRLGNSAASEEARPSVIALRDGGFLTAWEETTGDTGGEAGARDLRAALFDASGERAFSNPACGVEPFALASEVDGNQERPFFALHPDGAIAAVWTDRGSNDVIERGSSSIVSTVITEKSLLPLR